LSLHQRAAGEQPYDGRFAANIDDGEFLCPLCKQLSNILIPRDGCAMKDAPTEAITLPAKPPLAAKDIEESLRSLLTQGGKLKKSDFDAISDMGKKALSDFGGHLLQAMDVPWERTSGVRKRKHRRWHPAIQRWDYEEEDDDLDPLSQESSVKNILRLIRQQHIAWAAVGHSAAVSEASDRGVEEVLPFGSFSKTEDPWPSYADAKESDAMALELSRTMCGASGLLQVLMLEIAKHLAGSEMELLENGVSIVSRCLADILGGRDWTLGIKDTIDGNTSRDDLSCIVLWSQLSALMASVPCHVSRDGMLSQRHEARAAAAAMWTVRGSGTLKSTRDPPIPLAIERVFDAQARRPPEIPKNWGTMVPTAKERPSSSVDFSPFRPAVASAFLYSPFLSWDLNTLAGAMFSTILVNKPSQLPSSEDLMNLANVLIIGRMVQALITPHGFDSFDSMDLDEEDEEGRWNLGEIASEGEALSKLLAHCRTRIRIESLDHRCGLLDGDKVSSTEALFGSVGRAILPFARSVILMVRACNLAIKTRHKKLGVTVALGDQDAAFQSVIDGTETMATNDGFYILKEMQGPLPSKLVDPSAPWLGLINRWLTSIISLEKHHGSSGSSLVPEMTHVEKMQPNKKTASRVPVGGSATPLESGMSDAGQSAVGTETVASVASAQSMSTDAGADPQHEDAMSNDGAHPARFFVDREHMDSDDDLIEDMEMSEAEEMVDFADQVLRVRFADAAGAAGAPAGHEAEDSADEPSTSGSEDGGGAEHDSSHIYAGVSQSPIISYQPSLLATHPIGPGRQGSMFETATASAVMADLSHLGLTHRKDAPTFSLIRLPKSFVELYGLVNKIKGREDASALEESDDIGNAETAICLLTGAVMRSGSARRPYQRAQRLPGACTLHARKSGSGIGIFFLVQKCTVLLMHNNKSAYSASLYVDEHGEEDPGLRRGRPLFLNDIRYRALESLWRQQGIPREVAQIRSTSDRVIRDNWY
jgi:hypothetical protein